VADTAIEWTDKSWNPVTGCDRVSPGCAHCYALTLAARLKGMGNPRYQADGDPKTSGPGFGVTLHPDKLEEPLHWKKPRRIFVNSMSDLFHEAIPDDYIAQVFGVMAEAPQHTFQVLTKRPERMRDVLRSWGRADAILSDPPILPLPNVWLGVSIENRRFVQRADLLRETPAAVRFISAEPLLGPLLPFHGWRSPRDRAHDRPPERFWPDGYIGAALDLTDIDWLIVGGESGPKHRPIDEEWVRDLRDAANETQEIGWKCGECGWRTLDGETMRTHVLWPESDGAHSMVCPGCGAEGKFIDWIKSGTRFFFKQWGGRTPKANGRELDGRTWDEFPAMPEPIMAGGIGAERG
jgi:protein gp37